jgi:hypothetical protein
LQDEFLKPVPSLKRTHAQRLHPPFSEIRDTAKQIKPGQVRAIQILQKQ